jgi:hypothetical protein
MAMNKRQRAAAAVTIGSAVLLSSGVAWANDADVIRTGECSLGSDWKLKHSPENNGQILEIEFEVDQNVVGDVWKVQIRTNDVLVERTRATTVAPSGSFEVNEMIANPAGPDSTVAIARNTETGEVCRGRVTSDF